MTGQQKCRLLKQIRAEIARQNDIRLTIEHCPHKGECEGTCPRCEEEVRALEQALAEKGEKHLGMKLSGIAARILEQFQRKHGDNGDGPWGLPFVHRKPPMLTGLLPSDDEEWKSETGSTVRIDRNAGKVPRLSDHPENGTGAVRVKFSYRDDRGEHQQTRYLSDQLTIGRSPDSDITVNDVCWARRQAVLRRRGDRVEIIGYGLNSIQTRHGETCGNGRAVLLRPDDVLTLGKVSIHIQIQEADLE